MSETIAVEQPIPGVSGDELKVMQAGAARFLYTLEGQDGLDVQTSIRMAIEDLETLTRPAGSGGGRVPRSCPGLGVLQEARQYRPRNVLTGGCSYGLSRA